MSFAAPERRRTAVIERQHRRQDGGMTATTDDVAHPDAPDATYDVVVIGAGPVGENVADRASRTGLSVAIVEARLVGGSCSYWACMPSKTLLRPAALVAMAQDVPGVTVDATIDAAEVFAWRDRVVHGWDDGGQVDWLDGAGLTLLTRSRSAGG